MMEGELAGTGSEVGVSEWGLENLVRLVGIEPIAR